MGFIKIFDDDPGEYLLWDFDSYGFVIVLHITAGGLGEGATNSLPS